VGQVWYVHVPFKHVSKVHGFESSQFLMVTLRQRGVEPEASQLIS
jgi:hypothetical protein